MRTLWVLVFTLFAIPAFPQETTVTKNIFATPGPNLFYESPSLAWNEKNGSTLMVWERHPGNHPDHDLLARKISPAGAIRGSIRNLISGTNTYKPTLLYNKQKNEFVIIYADEFQNPTHTIFAQRLSAKGKIKGAPVRISTDTGSGFINRHPIATFDPVHKRYVVVWSRNSTTQGTFEGEGLMVAVLDQNLVPAADPILLRAESAVLPVNPFGRDVTVLLSGRILVVFTEPSGADAEKNHYYLAALDPDLSNLSIRKVNQKVVNNVFVDADFATLPSGLFLYFVDTNKIQKRKIDSTGRPVGAISSAFATPLKSKRLFFPRFAATPDSPTAGLLVAVEDARQENGDGTIWIQRVDATGTPNGAPEIVDSGFITAANPQILRLPSSTATTGHFSLIYINGSQITIPPRGEFSELIHLKLTVPLQQ